MTEDIGGATTPQLFLEREFDAPRDLVWRAWTEPERLARWWGAPGTTIRVEKFELKPAGVFLYSMSSAPAGEIWGKFTYRAVTPQHQLVFVSAFSDAQGGLARNPWLDTWPLEVLNTLTLTEGGGKTRLALRGRPINATAEELASFAAGVDGMQKGFAGTFEQLDRYLAGARARI